MQQTSKVAAGLHGAGLSGLSGERRAGRPGSELEGEHSATLIIHNEDGRKFVSGSKFYHVVLDGVKF
jgi:hypothetical protein